MILPSLFLSLYLFYLQVQRCKLYSYLSHQDKTPDEFLYRIKIIITITIQQEMLIRSRLIGALLVRACQPYRKHKLINVKKLVKQEMGGKTDVEKQLPDDNLMKESEKRGRMQAQKLYEKIKACINTRDLFLLFDRNKNRMEDGHLYAILRKAIHLANNRSDPNKKDKKVIEIVDYMCQNLHNATPEYQIYFLNILAHSYSVELHRRTHQTATTIMQEFKPTDTVLPLISFPHTVKLLITTLKLSLIYGEPCNKIPIGLCRAIMQYLQNHKLFEKINRDVLLSIIKYLVAVGRSLTLPMQQIKQIIKAIAKQQPTLHTSLIVFSLVMRSCSEKTLTQQLLRTNPNNLPHNPLYKTISMVHKKLTLPYLQSCTIQQVPHNLATYFHHVSNFSIEVLDRLNIMSSLWEKIYLALEYLGKIYTKVIPRTEVFWTFTYKLFGILLSPPVLNKLPTGILNKVNKHVLSELYTRYTEFAGFREIQVTLLELALRKNYSNQQEVMELFLSTTTQGLSRFQRRSLIPMYMKLLGHELFFRNSRMLPPSRTLIRRMFHHYQQFYQHGENMNIKNMSQGLMELYKQSAVYNKSIPLHTLSMQENKYRVRKFEHYDDKLSPSYETEMVLRGKIVNCLKRVKLMLAVYEGQTDNIEAVLDIFVEEWALLRYPNLYSYEDIDDIMHIYDQLSPQHLEQLAHLPQEQHILHLQKQKKKR